MSLERSDNSSDLDMDIPSRDAHIKICSDEKIKEEIKFRMNHRIENTIQTLPPIIGDSVYSKYILQNKYKPITLGPSELEKKLNDVRKKFEHTRRIDSELGLTPDPRSRLISPANELLDVENQIIERREELGFRRNTFWRSCCGQVIDRRATQFFTQVLLGGGVMIFCMAKIWYAIPLNGCVGEDTTVYFSLLSALIGFYIPSPSMGKQ
jgi:hypothetical protein